MRTLRLVFLLSILSAAIPAQDGGVALSTSVTYNTLRLSLKLTPEQAKEAARLGTEAAAAMRAGRFGESMNLFAQGTAVMRGVDWTPDVEYASSLRAKLDHAIAAPGGVTVAIAPLYPTPRAAAAKLNVTIALDRLGKEVAALTPKKALAPSERVVIPSDAAGDYNIQVRLTPSEGTVPEALRAVFVKTVPVHVEDLSQPLSRLRAALAKAPKANPALPTAEYALTLYDRVDQGEMNPRCCDFRKEFAAAQAMVEAIETGKDPFAGKHGDIHKAYRSAVDQTLQPYRVYVPTTYDGAKPLPLLVALYGMGGDENTFFENYGRELPVDAEKAGFIVVAPKGRDPASMYRGAAEQDVLDAMAEVERDYKVDRRRVYLMGHSMGGFGTWSIAMDHPDLFAALGPISGGGDPAGMVKLKGIPQYVTHGDDDRTVNVESSRSMVAAGKQAGEPITYVEVPGGSHVSVAQPAFAPMLEFFQKQSRP
jgi:poly(3-hydroxybutyrate) depolymerase